MRPELTLRPVGEDDLAFLQRVYASTRMEELEPTGWTADQKQAFLQAQFEAQHQHYVRHYPTASLQVVLLSGQAIGRRYVDEWADELRLMDVALLPEYRGRGIGGELIADVLARAAAAGKAVSVHVETFNPAMRLYLRLGFREVEDKGVYRLLEWRPGLR